MNTDELNAMIDYWQGRAERAEAAITLAKSRLESAKGSEVAAAINSVLGIAQNTDGEVI